MLDQSFDVALSRRISASPTGREPMNGYASAVPCPTPVSYYSDAEAPDRHRILRQSNAALPQRYPLGLSSRDNVVTL
jgi:hypothetical protein